MRRLILCRHGRSEANDGRATREAAAVGLTEEGQRQAEAFAENWALRTPDRVVVSPYLRTQQTAAPLLRRLGLCREVWPEVREFTYLSQPASPTTPEQRRPQVEQFWLEANPQRSDPGAESFDDFWRRTEAFGHRAAATADSLCLVFTHGLFIAAFDHQCKHGQSPVNSELMHHFDQLRMSPVGNAETVSYVWVDSGWSCLPGAGTSTPASPDARSGR